MMESKKSNPDAKVLVSFINSWFDLRCKRSCPGSNCGGADVLYAERFGVIEAAVEKGLYSLVI